METTDIPPYRLFRHNHPFVWSFLTSLPLTLVALPASRSWSVAIFVVWIVSQYSYWRPGGTKFKSEAEVLRRAGVL